MATVKPMQGRANGFRTIRFPTPALPERGSKGLLSAAAQSHGTPSELIASVGKRRQAIKIQSNEMFVQ
jgi:hypothetical protein